MVSSKEKSWTQIKILQLKSRAQNYKFSIVRVFIYQKKSLNIEIQTNYQSSDLYVSGHDLLFKLFRLSHNKGKMRHVKGIFGRVNKWNRHYRF